MEGERLHLPEHVHSRPERRKRVLLAIALTLGVVAIGVAQFMVTLGDGAVLGVDAELRLLQPELLPLSTSQAPSPEDVQTFQEQLQAIYQTNHAPPVSPPEPVSDTLPPTL